MSFDVTRESACVEIAADAIGRLDAALARQFETAVLQALGEEPPEPVIVRFGVWDGEDDGPRFVCKIEAVPTAAPGAAPAWRWWSPLVRTPAELGGWIREAVRARERSVPQPEPLAEFWGWASVGQAGA